MRALKPSTALAATVVDNLLAEAKGLFLVGIRPGQTEPPPLLTRVAATAVDNLLADEVRNTLRAATHRANPGPFHAS